MARRWVASLKNPTWAAAVLKRVSAGEGINWVSRDDLRIITAGAVERIENNDFLIQSVKITADCPVACGAICKQDGQYDGDGA
jgi:hypothetical protein